MQSQRSNPCEPSFISFEPKTDPMWFLFSSRHKKNESVK